MRISTTRFGEITISKKSILDMPCGMLGFEDSNRFVLLQDQADLQLKWLQSVDDPALAFIVVDPMDFFQDHDIELSDEDAEFLGLANPADAAILTTVTLDKNNGWVTTNLLGPVVINSRNLRAKQIVLQDKRYGTKHLIGRNICQDTTFEQDKAA